MEQFKRVKVVMITTNKFTLTTLCKCIRVNGLLMDALKLNHLSKPLTEEELEDANHGKDVIGIDRYFEAQHIHIISDDEIKLFDWVYNNKENIVEQITSKTQLIFVLEENKENQTFKKIIATTDASLYREESCTGYTETRSRTFYSKKPLPRPSKQFIEKYIEEYNKSNVITDVLVEHEESKCECLSCGRSVASTCNYPEKCNIQIISNLKINPKDNTITIT